MVMRSWIRNLFTRPAPRPIRKAPRLFRPALEVLENRWAPATFTVNGIGDTGAGSELTGDLRYCITQANLGGNNTIQFDPTVFATPQTITLAGAQLELSDTTGTEAITGPAAGVMVNGGGASRVFQVDSLVTASLSGLTITGGNAGAYYGGGLYNQGTLTLTNCTVSVNSASDGGGLFNTGTATLTNCTVSGNNAINPNDQPYYGGIGGGLFDTGTAFTATLTNCTVSGNSASNGGGIGAGAVQKVRGGSGLVVANTIIAGNTATIAPDIIGGVTSQGNNLIGKTDGSDGWIVSGGNADLTGTIAFPLDPLLAPLGNYGGPTQTMALRPGSPALGTGDPADTSADQRAAPAASPPDIGAFQANVVAFITDPTYSSGQVGLTLTAGDGSNANQADGFTYNINWGDGTAENPGAAVVPATAENGNGVLLSHSYAPGVYTVTVTATDADGAVSQTATALVVVSTTANDHICLSGGSTPGQVQLAVSSQPGASGAYSPTDLVYVSGQESSGADTYTVNFGSTLTTPIALFGAGTGGDTLVVNGATSSTNVISKTVGQITWGNPVTETVYRSGILNTTINANGTSSNSINDPGGNTVINGGPGANTITITATSGNGVTINGGPSTNNYIIDLGSLAGPVAINNANAASANNLVVNGAAGNNTITASGSQVTEGSQTLNLNASLTSATINGGSGNNQITVDSLTVPVATLNLTGGGGNNTFMLVNVGASVAAVAITGSATGTNQVQVEGSAPANIQGHDNITPTVQVSDAGGVYNAGTFAATATVAGVSGTTGASLEGVTPTLTYYSGAYTSVGQLTGVTGSETAPSTPGNYTVLASFAGSADYTAASALATFTITAVGVTIGGDVYVLNQTASGALTLSGNAVLNVGNTLQVDSSSASAVKLSGNAHVNAAHTLIVGGDQVSGNAQFNHAPTLHDTGASVADPLAALAAPTGGASYAAVNLSGNSTLTINPGVYPSISVSGNARLILTPGIYIIGSGGITISGNATITNTTAAGGLGVLIYSNGALTVNGNASVNLTASSTGVYAGVAIFQARNDASAVMVSGNANLNLNGSVLYDANVQSVVTLSGNAKVDAALVVNELTIAGNSDDTAP